MKPAPFTVSVKDVPPAPVDAGDRLESVSPEVMVNVNGAGEVWPGTDTPTDAVPAVAIKFAGTVAVNWFAETNAVLSANPFQVMSDPLVNADPVAVRVNAGPPATVVFGEMPVSVTGTAVMVNVAALETRFPLAAVIEADPG